MKGEGEKEIESGLLVDLGFFFFYLVNSVPNVVFVSNFNSQ